MDSISDAALGQQSSWSMTLIGGRLIWESRIRYLTISVPRKLLLKCSCNSP